MIQIAALMMCAVCVNLSFVVYVISCFAEEHQGSTPSDRFDSFYDGGNDGGSNDGEGKDIENDGGSDDGGCNDRVTIDIIEDFSSITPPTEQMMSDRVIRERYF